MITYFCDECGREMEREKPKEGGPKTAAHLFDDEPHREEIPAHWQVTFNAHRREAGGGWTEDNEAAHFIFCDSCKTVVMTAIKEVIKHGRQRSDAS